ncbi:CG5953 [Drosophila busckii]|uniref:CG5953 n=1 Tax=Drosophila busckii TaxID=30019 RepID=A0A0M4E2V1_DROBS|nr:CG5953 [Drosophila busckii]
MNYTQESVVAAAVAAANQHHLQAHQHQHIIPLPNYSGPSALGSGAGSGSNAGSGVGGGGDSSPKIMEWTNDDALELIEQYRCHTELWNRADPKYKDKLCRFRAWSEIADRFGCSKAEVERKMNVLLTQYRREKHKMFVKLYQGIQPNPSKWYAFKRFDFMEAGGGSLSGPVATSVAGSAALNGLNGLAAAAAAYESSTVNAAANCGAGLHHPLGGGGTTTTTSRAATPASQHRRIKTKELKYFGAMGLNIPMLIASSQTMDNWNTAGQYSPPIGGAGGGAGGPGGGANAQQLRVPMPMAYASGGGGGSSSSDFQPSPHKTMDTSDNEDNNNRTEATAAALGQLAAKVERRSPLSCNTGGCSSSVEGGMGGGESTNNESINIERDPAALVTTALSEAGSSPIPNTNMHEAHKNHLRQTSPASVRAVTPRQAHEQLHHGHHALPSQQQQQQPAHQHAHHSEDLDIKQELVDYFHAAPGGGGGAPAPPDTHRSYSSAGEESRMQLEMAQDLRVAQAKATLGGFVLPPRCSSAQLTSMPLNMRKLSPGHMLMNTLLNSRESMSDADGDVDNDEATESAASPGHIKSSVSAQAASAAALYAESLNRDDFDFVGSNVSMKLRTMDRTQRIIAEKLISEVLYYGQFNELERTARIQPK